MTRPARMKGRPWRTFQERKKKRKSILTYVLKSTKRAIQYPPKSQEVRYPISGRKTGK
jgi:hypothetical protein